MSDIILEKKVEDYPCMISLKNTKRIKSQMEKGVCKINIGEGKNGTGFFTEIKFNENEIHQFLVTNDHVIGEEFLKNEKKILIDMEDKKNIPITIDKSRKTYNNKELDVTFIEINKKDNIECTYLELDSDLELDDEILKIKYEKKSIYIIQYPGKEICVSYGIIKFLENFDINHFCNTESGTSGSPILSLDSFKIIGIHRKANINYKYNTGSLLKKAIEDFKNKFLAQININNNFIKNENLNNFNTNIIFKNPNKITKMNEINIRYLIKENEEEIKLFGEEFVNNNKENCILSFNNKNYELCDYIKYDEYKINKNEDSFEVVLKEKKKITNMSNMFSGCESLISIWNIDKWDTQNVTNMSKMFELCSSLCSLPKSLDWNTSKVTDISYIFSTCKKLTDIPDISKWDISNVNNMKGMFKRCESIKTLPDISNWNTSNITDMSEMFCGCVSLTKLPDISKWETKNVKKMREMFLRCDNLSYLPNISNWNIINVTDRYHIFHRCKSLKSIPDIFK